MKRIAHSFLVLGALSVSACGPNYFVKGKPLAPAQDLTIVTMPTGAVASNNHGNSCITPCKLPLLTARGGEIMISKDGYRTELHYIGSDISEARVVRRAASNAVEAIDPDPVSIALTALGNAVSGKGALMDLDRMRIMSELIPLEDGEEDVLGRDAPLTGERIPIDISAPVLQ